ncbi:LacI family transcriptional regulator [Herbiconiux moechotypicola]|uniref:Substrate-binding domain-containing protein n=1 Tax=Herbiconiux moechotypicola TaxID=637393 RepID=A0ABN3D9X7_9MICO|nr:LacI family DNA-binding transcriptional regulator [Herbiconiux moechotypicola]MCS5729023.1 LacI family transcriptional regulator [Herbiconiux moechotypicola]
MARSTIGDVARLAGVSTATVSRVLTGSVPVSAQLREKVNAAATALDYTVNTTARALRRDRTLSVGMVVPDLSNPFFTLLVDGVERRLQGLGLTLHLCSSGGDPATEAARIRSLQQSQVEVLVVAAAHVEQSGPVLREAMRRTPVVQLDQFADGVDGDWIGVDERLGMRLVLEHLAEQGARTAAYIGGQPHDSSARVRFEAARSEAAAFGIRLEADERLLGAFSSGWGDRAARLLVEAGLPDAVVCGADVVALGVLQGFDALGVRVPDDVLVTGFDDIPLSAHPRLSITTVRQPLDRLAELAVEAVEEIVDGAPERHPHRIAVAPELVVRSSSMRSPS